MVGVEGKKGGTAYDTSLTLRKQCEGFFIFVGYSDNKTFKKEVRQEGCLERNRVITEFEMLLGKY